MKAGCSLSSSITGKDVRILKEKYPDVPVVSYVNTSADVKTETDASLMGGLKLRVGNTLIDGSVYSRLQKMRDTLIQV